MNKQEYPLVKVAVTLVMRDNQEFLWTYNPNWGSFALPMTKLRTNEGGIEEPSAAAARAAAEVLGVPVEVGEHWHSIPELKVSGRDRAVRRYSYEIYRVGPHPDFAAVAARPDLLWLNVERAFTWTKQPRIAQASQEILSSLIIANKIQKRSQLVSTLIIQRNDGRSKQFLLRWNKDWGFALPSKRRHDGETPMAAARRTAHEELQLQPDQNVIITPAAVENVPIDDQSGSTDLPSFYAHSVFDAKLSGAAVPVSPDPDLPLVWATEQEIKNHEREPILGAREGKATRGQISRTVFRILSAEDDLPWIDWS